MTRYLAHQQLGQRHAVRQFVRTPARRGRPHRRLAPAALCCLSLLLAAPAAAERAPESRLRLVLDSLLDHRETEAFAEVERLLSERPNFQLAHIFYADLLAARAHQSTLLSNTQALRRARVSGLVDEAVARLLHETPRAGLRPASVAALAPRRRYALLLDAAHSRLYLMENQDGEPRIADSYYASIGNAGMDKARQGDNKTPSGVYFPTTWHDGDALPDLYGSGAWPLNYPNLWDDRHGRDGSGIWLHGTPAAIYSRPPRDSRGCVVMNNDELRALHARLGAAAPAVVLAPAMRWLPADEWRAQRAAALAAVERWRLDWESLEVERYLAHYATDYRDIGEKTNRDYARMTRETRRNARNKTWIKLRVENIEIFRYPGERDVMLALFDQDYRSNNYAVAYRKQQFWRRDDGGAWRIVAEGRAPAVARPS